MIKRFIPKFIRLNYKLSARYINDLASGNIRKFAKGDRKNVPYNGMVETQETVLEDQYADNKLSNIRLASKEISKLQILSGEIFSFWNAVGKPTAGRGYKNGLNLIAGELKEDIGGGLCQLSGLIYQTALKSGLEILERHPHSKDIFTDNERNTPLGADAAVTYGYKDLRIKNSRGFPIKFTFIIKDNNVSCRIFLEDNISPFTTKFKKREAGESKKVTTILVDKYGKEEEIGESEYLSV